jgi:hypothetical protein
MAVPVGAAAGLEQPARLVERILDPELAGEWADVAMVPAARRRPAWSSVACIPSRAARMLNSIRASRAVQRRGGRCASWAAKA